MKRGAQSLQATLLRKQLAFLRRWRRWEPRVHSRVSFQILLPPHRPALASLSTPAESPTVPAPPPRSSARGNSHAAEAESRVSKVKVRRRTGQQLLAWAEEEGTVTLLGAAAPAPRRRARLPGACPWGLHGWFAKQAWKVSLSSCHQPERYAGPLGEAARTWRWVLCHKAPQATGPAQGHRCVLGVEFPD